MVTSIVTFYNQKRSTDNFFRVDFPFPETQQTWYNKNPFEKKKFTTGNSVHHPLKDLSRKFSFSIFFPRFSRQTLPRASPMFISESLKPLWSFFRFPSSQKTSEIEVYVRNQLRFPAVFIFCFDPIIRNNEAPIWKLVMWWAGSFPEDSLCLVSDCYLLCSSPSRLLLWPTWGCLLKAPWNR